MSHQIALPPGTTTPPEMVMASFQVKRLHVLVGCVYRPPNSTQEYTNMVTSNLLWTQQQHQDAVYLVGGDFNLPDINWEDQSISGHQNLVAINNGYLNCFQDLGLEQIVNFPSRYNPDRTLDLLLTHPTV